MECRACIRSPALSYAPCVLAHDGDGWNWFAAAINTRTGRAIAWDRLAGPDLSPLLLVDGIDFNAGQQSTCRAQNRVSVSHALERIRKIARERKKERFTALFHHLSIDLLEEANTASAENGWSCGPARRKPPPIVRADAHDVVGHHPAQEPQSDAGVGPISPDDRRL